MGLLDIQDSGYLYRNENNEIVFDKIRKNNYEKLLKIKQIEKNYQIELNDFSFDEDGNVKSHNSTWFLLRKKFLEERMNSYNLKEGDILRIGRITIKIKTIKFNKNKYNNKSNKDIIDNNSNKDNNISFNTNVNVKEANSQANNNKLYEKEEAQKSKICRICYLEDDTIDNPLIQPCICSGSMKYIHLDCLKHWIQTSIFVKIEDYDDCSIYLYNTPECELCKTKYTDYIKHKGRLYEILDLKNDFNNYLILESITLDRDQKKYLYVINLDNPTNKINIGRGHDSQILLSDISVSRCHCFLTIDKKSKNIYIHDNNSKFGTLILVQTKNIVMSFHLKLGIQIGRTYLEFLLKEPFSLFNCCGVSDKKNEDFYFIQNKEISFLCNELTIKNANSIEHFNKFKIKNEDFNTDNLDNLLTKQIENDIELKEMPKKGSKENSIIDDIEQLIDDNEPISNNNKNEEVDKNENKDEKEDENIVNNESKNKVERNNESIHLSEINDIINNN